MTKVLLYSGGMDSWIIDKLYKPDIKLFIDVKTPSSIEERKRLPKDVIVKEFDLSEYEEKNEKHLLPLRNLILAELGSYYGDEICLGAVGGSIHYDNNETFRKQAEDLLNYLYSENNTKKVKIVLPYMNTTKEELVKLYKDSGGNLKEAFNQSFSCYEPINGKECGKCISCKQKIEAFKKNGYIEGGEINGKF